MPRAGARADAADRAAVASGGARIRLKSWGFRPLLMRVASDREAPRAALPSVRSYRTSDRNRLVCRAATAGDRAGKPRAHARSTACSMVPCLHMRVGPLAVGAQFLAIERMRAAADIAKKITHGLVQRGIVGHLVVQSLNWLTRSEAMRPSSKISAVTAGLPWARTKGSVYVFPKRQA